MIIKPSPDGLCYYCKEPVGYSHPWHSPCWLAAQAARNPTVRQPDDEPCYFVACTRPATTYSKVLGCWERVCAHHADEGYSLARSHTYIAELLDGCQP